MGQESKWMLWSVRSMDGLERWAATRDGSIRVLTDAETFAAARRILKGRADAWNEAVDGCDGECVPPDESDARRLCDWAAVRLAQFLCEQSFWHLATLWTDGPRAVWERNRRKWEAAGFEPDDPALFLAEEKP
jgi:hypothetical protein